MAHALPPEVEILFSASTSDQRDAAWERFLQTHSRLILYACRRNGGSSDEVMDRYAYVVEELRTGDFKRLRAFDGAGPGKFSSWLLVVARRLCVDRHRRQFGRVPKTGSGAPPLEHVARKRLAELMGEELDIDTLVDSSLAPPDAAVRTEELRRALEQALAGLEPRDQLIITLRFQDDLSVRKIAKILGHPNPSRVYRRIDAILSSLRHRMERRGFTDAEA